MVCVCVFVFVFWMSRSLGSGFTYRLYCGSLYELLYLIEPEKELQWMLQLGWDKRLSMVWS